MKRKILVVYATAGIGHRKAALAVYETLRSRYNDIEVKLIDILDYTNPFFKKAYSTTYLFLINRLIFLWGFFYHTLNCKIAHFLLLPLRQMLHVSNSTRFIEFMREYKPDVVISTHFVPPDICGYLKKKYRQNVHVINVITDYRPHSFWVSNGVDTYAVGHFCVKKELMDRWGIPAESIRVTGIPIEEKFSKEINQSSLRKKFGISTDSFTVLLLSGGYGVGPVGKIIKLLNMVNFPLTVIVVAGYNKKLYASVDSFKRKAKIQIINFGYVDNIEELMSVSDVCIGKAGGMSTTEALARNLPFIFVRPIPGQERANAWLFAEIGAGIKLKTAKEVLSVITELKNSPEKMMQLKEAIKRARRVCAAFDIATYAAEILGKIK